MRRRGRGKRITIAIDYEWPRMKVAATVFGIWAVHRCPEKSLRRAGWRVTHVPSGYCLSSRSDGLSKGDAMRVALLLAERVPAIDHRTTNPDDGFIVDAVFGEAIGR